MADREIVDALISTYRNLNSKVRPLPEDRLRVKGGSGSVREVVRRLRDDELRFSQSLKEKVSGVPMTMSSFDGEETPLLGTESDDDSTATMLAQFGTARESTLAMLRSLPDADWGVGDNDSVRSMATRLVANDKKHLDRIVGLLGSP